MATDPSTIKPNKKKEPGISIYIFTRNIALKITKKTKFDPPMTTNIMTGKICGRKPILIDPPQSKPLTRAYRQVSNMSQKRLFIGPPKN